MRFLLEPGDRRGHDDVAESAAEAIDRDRNVIVLVGVDADDDIATPTLHAGHRAVDPLSHFPGGLSMAQLAGVGGQDCDEALVESGSYQVTAHPASSLVNATTRGRHVNARAPAGPVISKGQTPGGGAVTMLAVISTD